MIVEGLSASPPWNWIAQSVTYVRIVVVSVSRAGQPILLQYFFLMRQQWHCIFSANVKFNHMVQWRFKSKIRLEQSSHVLPCWLRNICVFVFSFLSPLGRSQWNIKLSKRSERFWAISFHCSALQYINMYLCCVKSEPSHSHTFFTCILPPVRQLMSCVATLWLFKLLNRATYTSDGAVNTA